MSTRTAKESEEGEDILGLVAFGSLVANIFQIASKKSLTEEYEALKAYATELRRHFENMKVRERLVYNKNLELKKANEGLITINNRLLRELVEVKNEIIALKGNKPGFPVRKRLIRKSTGGSL